jgi:hypothetical protein
MKLPNDMIKELDSVVLTTDLPEHGLAKDDIGTVVLVHEGGKPKDNSPGQSEWWPCASTERRPGLIVPQNKFLLPSDGRRWPQAG